MNTIVIATRNAHKAREVQALLGTRFKYFTLKEFSSIPPIAEIAPTFEQNAKIKSEAVANWLLLKRGTERTQGWAVLGDDSGLEVDALNGEPGVYSARFASAELRINGNAPDAANTARLLRLLEGVADEQRTARFRCSLALTEIISGLPTTLFSGTCEGRIGTEPRGTNGFGYDPVFFPQDSAQTFAEISNEEKGRISHRALAIGELKTWLHRRHPVPA